MFLSWTLPAWCIFQSFHRLEIYRLPPSTNILQLIKSLHVEFHMCTWTVTVGVLLLWKTTQRVWLVQVRRNTTKARILIIQEMWERTEQVENHATKEAQGLCTRDRQQQRAKYTNLTATSYTLPGNSCHNCKRRVILPPAPGPLQLPVLQPLCPLFCLPQQLVAHPQLYTIHSSDIPNLLVNK